MNYGNSWQPVSGETVTIVEETVVEDIERDAEGKVVKRTTVRTTRTTWPPAPNRYVYYNPSQYNAIY